MTITFGISACTTPSSVADDAELWEADKAALSALAESQENEMIIRFKSGLS